MAPSPQDGVVKFEIRHTQEALSRVELQPVLAELLGWRVILHRLGLVGQDPARYQGAGYGNLSARLPPFAAPPGARLFAVTGTQTGGRAALTPDELCVVTTYDQAHNRVHSRGLVEPSSESMTHGAVYDQDASIRFVFHVHAPELWRRARGLGLPRTRPEVGYGTPAMALEVERLFRESDVRARGALAMDGHEDGVVSFGATAREAGGALLDLVARAASGR